jgi:hypothetical protein
VFELDISTFEQRGEGARDAGLVELVAAAQYPFGFERAPSTISTGSSAAAVSSTSRFAAVYCASSSRTSRRTSTLVSTAMVTARSPRRVPLSKPSG